MVSTALAEELRTGDVAVAGSKEHADWSEQLLSWEDVEGKLDDYLVEIGLAEPGQAAPYDAVSFRRRGLAPQRRGRFRRARARPGGAARPRARDRLRRSPRAPSSAMARPCGAGVS
ncbi:hypothetical protein ACGFRB_24225 [Streptomyces sp. NPDC048718]|uniref:hypothetical protein n=1 Tax=Streptomyces sp. NPDC048718 TaxID=3365587 RepID=UPI00371CF8DC